MKDETTFCKKIYALYNTARTMVTLFVIKELKTFPVDLQIYYFLP